MGGACGLCLPATSTGTFDVSRVKVLQVVASSRGGGAGHVLDLCRGLDDSRFTVQVAMPEDGGHVSRESFARAGIGFHAIGIAGGISLTALRALRSISAGADIVHVHGSRAALFGRLAALSLGRQRPRVVYSIHGFAAPHYGTPKRQTLLTLDRVLAHHTDHWICVSRAEQDALLAAHLADPERVTMIWNGIDAGRFRDAARKRSEMRIALDLPQEALVLTTVCRLYRPRDFPTLLQAFQRLRAAVPLAHLLIVGDGPLRPLVEQGIMSLGLGSGVRLLGMRSDVPEILGATDLFVLASRGWEGLPLAALEAMAASLPVVASDVGGTREALVDGQTGYLFPPGDVSALARRLEYLARNPALRHALGKNGRDRVAREFGLERMVSETIEVYLDLCPEAQAGALQPHGGNHGTAGRSGRG